MTETSNYIHKEASKLFDKNSSSFNEKKYFSTIYEKYIPVINKINKISVSCKFSITKRKYTNGIEYFCDIKLMSNKIYMIDTYTSYTLYCLSESIKKFSPKYINDFLIKFKNLIPKLIIDKYEGKFINSEEKKSVFQDEKYFGLDIFGIEFDNYDECVVCYENTTTITSCNHHLCIDCWTKLKKNYCPICREYLNMKDEDEEDDEDDEEDD